MDRFGSAVSQLQLYLNGSESNYTFASHSSSLRVKEWDIADISSITNFLHASQPSKPVPSGLTLLPPYLHRDHGLIHDPKNASFVPHYFQNISGFYREADTHYLNLTHPSESNSTHHFFHHLITKPQNPQGHDDILESLVNMTAWNATVAEAKRGDFPWANVTSWALNLNEREIRPRDAQGHLVSPKDHNSQGTVQFQGIDGWEDWSWVHVVR